ncbi:SAM-dependent methyltransferase [Leisingera aquaemixtae]|uniref:SAM-dependent methyltransferase n=1 Tax=Leisingera aquaemixtae TaxID=1396826 RepID=UPI00398418CE
MFGRAAEEPAAARDAGIDAEIVPGITAACAAAAQTSTPLTERGGLLRQGMLPSTPVR